jgi:hypothetical protein
MSIFDKAKEAITGTKEKAQEAAQETKEHIQLQSDILKLQYIKMMDDFKVIELANIASKKGEPVDMQKLDEVIENINKMIAGAGPLSVVMKPMQKQMKNWYKDIQKSQPAQAAPVTLVVQAPVVEAPKIEPVTQIDTKEIKVETPIKPTTEINEPVAKVTQVLTTKPILIQVPTPVEESKPVDLSTSSPILEAPHTNPPSPIQPKEGSGAAMGSSSESNPNPFHVISRSPAETPEPPESSLPEPAPPPLQREPRPEVQPLVLEPEKSVQEEVKP